MKVAVNGILNPKSGGANVAANLTFTELSMGLSPGDSIEIITTPLNRRFSKYLGELYDKIITIKMINSVTRRFGIYFKSRLEIRLLKGNFDCVIFLSPTNEASKLKSIPCVTTVWDLGHRELKYYPETGANGIFENREQQYIANLKKSIYTITDSKITASKLASYYGLDVSQFLAMPFAPKKSSGKRFPEDFAFYPANFWKHKNHSILLKALALNKRNGIASKKLVLTGADKGFLNHIKHEAKFLGISDQVEILGFVSSEKLNHLYSTAELVLMPSLMGPTNLPPLEALLTGCPIAVSPEAVNGFEYDLPFIKIHPFDTEGWAHVLSSQFKPGSIDSQYFERVFQLQRERNIETARKMFNDIKRYYVN